MITSTNKSKKKLNKIKIKKTSSFTNNLFNYSLQNDTITATLCLNSQNSTSNISSNAFEFSANHCKKIEPFKRTFNFSDLMMFWEYLYIKK